MNISLNFKPQFAPKVESGEKRQTIRQLRRDLRQAFAGDSLYLFTGMRTKQCRRLETVKCKMATEIYIDTLTHNIYVFDKKISTLPASMTIQKDIAKRDGFDSLASFFDFFREQYGDGNHRMILYRW